MESLCRYLINPIQSNVLDFLFIKLVIFAKDFKPNCIRGYIRAEFKLTNTGDVLSAKAKHIKKKDIRSGTYRFLLDSGASLLCINEEIQAQLGLAEIGEETASLADGSIHKFKIVGPVTVEFENRRTTAEAVVLPKSMLGNFVSYVNSLKSC